MGFLLAMVVFHHGQTVGHSGYHFAQKPNRLKIVLKNPLNQPKLNLQSTVVKNRKLIGQIYNKMQHLPDFPSQTINCPMDDGTNYKLTFLKDHQTVLTAKVQRTGCGGVSFSGSNRWIRMADSDFLSMIEKALKTQ
jgi:hypothetical protein